MNRCQLCGADDDPPERKMFGYSPPSFFSCKRCGKFVCDFCIMTPPDTHCEYSLICSECYKYLEERDRREREEYWRQREAEKEE